MDLTFSESNGVYACSTSVSSNFNLHLEVGKTSLVRVYVSTIETGKKMMVVETQENECFDMDFNALVYSKYLTIEVSTMPTKAVITEV